MIVIALLADSASIRGIPNAPTSFFDLCYDQY